MDRGYFLKLLFNGDFLAYLAWEIGATAKAQLENF